jgi:hypothetical protein
MNKKYVVTIRNLDEKVPIQFIYSEYEQALTDFIDKCGQAGRHIASVGDISYEIKIQIFHNDKIARTKKVIINGFDSNYAEN